MARIPIYNKLASTINKDIEGRLPAPFSVIPLYHHTYSHALVSENGYALAKINKVDGTWELSLADDAVVGGMANSELVSVLAGVSNLGDRLQEPFSVVVSDSPNYSHFILSENGFILARIERDTGKWDLALSDNAPLPEGWRFSLLADTTIRQDLGFGEYYASFRDSEGNFLGGWKKDGTFRVALSEDSTVPENMILSSISTFLNSPTFINNGVSGPGITCIGDSLTASAGSSGFSARYPSVLATMTGRTVTNLGVGGESARTIFGRVGAWPYRVSVSGGIIPESGPIEVTMTSMDGQVVSPLLQGSAGLNPCYIGSVEGTLSRDSGTGVYSFTRTTAGDAVILKHPVSLVTNSQRTRMGDILVVDVGQNGGFTDDAQLMAMHNALFANQTSAVPRGLVIGRNTGTLSSRASLHDAYMRTFGARFINLLQFISSTAAFDIVGVTPTSEDLSAISAGSFPPSFWSSPTDSIHGNDYFYYLKAYAVDERLRQLGWI